MKNSTEADLRRTILFFPMIAYLAGAMANMGGVIIGICGALLIGIASMLLSYTDRLGE